MNFISKFHMGTRWRLRLINSLLNIEDNDVILDAGCGDGYISYKISKKVRKLSAVDISKKVIDKNMWYNDERLEFMQMDLEDLPKKIKRKYDKILVMDVLEHTKYFRTIINSLLKVMRKKGEILITIPVFEGHGHFKYNDFKFLRKYLTQKGFDIIKLEYIQMPFFTNCIDKLIKWMRRLAGYKMKETDSFENTLSYEQKEKETIVFKVYKIMFSVLNLFTCLDFKTYEKGEDFILIKAKKR